MGLPAGLLQAFAETIFAQSTTATSPGNNNGPDVCDVWKKCWQRLDKVGGSSSYSWFGSFSCALNLSQYHICVPLMVMEIVTTIWQLMRREDKKIHFAHFNLLASWRLTSCMGSWGEGVEDKLSISVDDINGDMDDGDDGDHKGKTIMNKKSSPIYRHDSRWSVLASCMFEHF